MEGVRCLLVLVLGLLAFTAVGCSRSSGEATTTGSTTGGERASRLDAARLRELDLTYQVPAQVRRACADARRVARVRVICPPLVPDVPLTRIEGLWGAIVVDVEPRWYMLTFNNGGLPGGKRHWITGGGAASVVQKWILTDFQNEVEGDPELVQTLTVAGRRVAIYRFPPFPAGGPNGGHWAAFVRVGDQLVFASPHGRRYVDAAIQMVVALADKLEAKT
jgi:hypothetical protein